MRSRKWLDRADGGREVLPSKCDNVKVAVGDVLHYVTWGGGGFGDPFTRDPALVALEVRRGLVTAEGAARYGVVLTGDGGVDEPATTALRERLSAERGGTKVFEFGSGDRRAARAVPGGDRPARPAAAGVPPGRRAGLTGAGRDA